MDAEGWGAILTLAGPGEPMLFMQAARWADDIRSNDKQQHPCAVALHQLPLQTRRTTVQRANQRAGVGEHLNCDG